MPASYTDSNSQTAGTGRAILDAPPTHPRQRSAPSSSERTRKPKSKLSSLALSTPDGEIPADDIDPETGGSDLDSHPVVQMFEHYAQARGHLQIVGTISPAVLAPVQDLLTLLDQMIPQQAAAMLSGAPGMGAVSPAAGTPQLTAAQGPPMGLEQLAGVGGVGAPGSQPPGPMTPGAMM